MDKNLIKAKVLAEIAYTLDISESKFTLETELYTAKGLNADDLDKVDLIMNLEDSFAIQLDDNQFEKCQTVESLVNFIESKVK